MILARCDAAWRPRRRTDRDCTTAGAAARATGWCWPTGRARPSTARRAARSVVARPAARLSCAVPGLSAAPPQAACLDPIEVDSAATVSGGSGTFSYDDQGQTQDQTRWFVAVYFTTARELCLVSRRKRRWACIVEVLTKRQIRIGAWIDGRLIGGFRRERCGP